MDSLGVFSPEALRPHLSMGLPFSTGRSLVITRVPNRGLRHARAHTAKFSTNHRPTMPMVRVIVTPVVAQWRHNDRMRIDRYHLPKWHTRCEAGSQSHGSPRNGKTAGLPNRFAVPYPAMEFATVVSNNGIFAVTDHCGHRLVVCAQGLPRAVAEMGPKGGESSEVQDGIVPLGYGGRLRPPLFSRHGTK